MAILRPLLEHARQLRAPASLDWPPLNIGHRGASGSAPENTLVSFDLALRQGADGIEFDVQLSSDGVPVVIHDARLDRTTSGSGRVSEHCASVLRRLDAGSWFNRRFPARARERYAGARIPLLAEALAWVGERCCRALVEIKDPTPGAEAKVLDEIAHAGVWPLVTILSFNLPTLRRLRQLDAQAPLGLDVSRRLLAIRHARSLAATAVLPHYAIASRRFIRHAHRASLHVIPWTIDQPLWMRRRIEDGVDGIITNFPARLAEIRARLLEKVPNSPRPPL
ncbi:MAG: glycerophosphodiester phosphodiesterase [Acidobacteriia bacterium]|nr:glycerophosphodiester phosphodiesterase [Terriglobia bacterium]